MSYYEGKSKGIREQIKWFNEINAKNIEIRWCGCNYTNTDNYGIYMYFIVSLSWIVSKK
jgi:hypothetical protein